MREHTLYPRLHWMEGRASSYRLEILAPDGTVLGDRLFYEEEGIAYEKGYNTPDSMMSDMWVDADNVIHFHVREKYDNTRRNNQFRVRIHTYRTGEVYTSEPH